MNKIISFCAYGTKDMYVKAVLKNLDLQPKIYPDWKVRVYVEDGVNGDLYKEMEDKGAELIRKPKPDGHLGMFWRFEPLKDETVDAFIVRDTDSRLNEREAAAVQEWMDSDFEFHIMRDNEQHRAYICGGMWGAKKSFIMKEKDSFDKEVEMHVKSVPFNQIYGARGKYFNMDQPWLWKYIWPKVVNTHMAHVSEDHFDLLKFTGRELKFPIKNADGSFVGEPFQYG